jgi:hypothetical protein
MEQVERRGNQQPTAISKLTSSGAEARLERWKNVLRVLMFHPIDFCLFELLPMIYSYIHNSWTEKAEEHQLPRTKMGKT